MKELTREEEAFIDSVELAIDWRMPLQNKDYEKYEELIKKRSELNGEPTS